MAKAKFDWTVILFLLLVIFASTGLALPPEITPFTELVFTEGMQESQQMEVNGHGDILTYSLTDAPNGMRIDANTGMVTYWPNIGEDWTFDSQLTVSNQNDEESVQVFDVIINPALAVVNVGVGSSQDNIVSVANFENTPSFHPGDSFVVDVEIKNQYTVNNNPFVNTPIRPTFERVSLKVESEAPFNIINGNYPAPEALTAQFVYIYHLKGQIPNDIPQGEYPVILTLAGQDQGVPANLYQTQYVLFVPVERNPHDFTFEVIKPDSIFDGVLSCQESNQENIVVKIANIGRVNENVDIILSTNLEDNQEEPMIGVSNLNLLVGQEKTINLQTDLPRNDQNNITIKVFRTQDHTTAMAEAEILYHANQCQDIQVLSKSPSDDAVNMHISESRDFSLAINNPSNLIYTLDWDLDGSIVSNEVVLHLRNLPVGEHQLRAFINKNTPLIQVEEWTIIVSNTPRGFDAFPGVHTTNLAAIINPRSTPLTLENANGMITYDQNVDISGIVDLAGIISIQDGRLGVNSGQALSLNRAATVTLYHNYSNPKVLVQPGFNLGNLVACGTCQIRENANGQITFHVNGFSTYVVVEDVPAAISINPISINSIKVGQQGNVTITITNTGSEDLTNLAASLQSVDPKYQAHLIGSLPAILGSGEQASTTLALTVPQSESQISHIIGSVLVSATEISATQNIILDPASFLTIDSVKINGKTSGKLELKDNTFEVRVRNDYLEDMQDVAVTVRILDVDGDDLEEEADTFNLNVGSDKKATVHIDLSNEKLDEERYVVEIEVEGDADDGTYHQTTFEQSSSVSRERHDLFLSRYELYPILLSCDTQASLHVTIENKGKNDENDVVLKIRNEKLGLSDSRTAIDLDDFSGSDNEYAAIFPIDVKGKAAGSYPITIELYRDGDLDETQTVTLTLKNCETTITTGTSSTTLSDSNLAANLQQELNNALSGRTETPKSSVQTSFRDTTVYVFFLGTLVFLILIAVILAIAVAIKRR